MHDLSFLSALNLSCDVSAPLSRYTTFRLGGVCPVVVTCRSPEELERCVLALADRDIDFLVMGGGSNLVPSDSGLPCPVVRYLCDVPALLPSLLLKRGHDLEVAGSVLLDQAVVFAAEYGLEGLNYASGIPGTVAGAVAGNAGAFGQQVGDVLTGATVMNRHGELRDIGPDDFAFSYRHSRLKETDDIIVRCRFRLKAFRKQSPDQPTLLEERARILGLRAQKHPDLQEWACAGSFFRNIEPTSKAKRRQAAGWFLEQAGAKDLKIGGAEIFPKHANMIVARNGATSQDVYDLSRIMAERVKDKFGLELVREVRFAGSFRGRQAEPPDLIW